MILLAQDNPHMKSNLSKEYSTSKRIVIIQVAYFLMMAALSSIIHVTFDMYKMMSMDIFNSIADNIMMTIITMVAYKSLTVKQQFENINKLNPVNNLDVIYISVFRVDRSVKCLDKYVSTFTILYLLVNQIFCVSTLCQMALNSHIRFIHNFITIVYGLINISVVCFICDIIPSSLDSLVDRLEIRLNDLNDRSIGCYDTKQRQRTSHTLKIKEDDLNKDVQGDHDSEP